MERTHPVLAARGQPGALDAALSAQERGGETPGARGGRSLGGPLTRSESSRISVKREWRETQQGRRFRDVRRPRSPHGQARPTPTPTPTPTSNPIPIRHLELDLM